MTETQNPYQPPVSSIEWPPITLPIVPASAGRRFLNFLIDHVTYLLFCIIVGFILGLAVLLIAGQSGIGKLIEIVNEIPNILSEFLFLTGYYLFFEGVFNRTPGKFITGTIVVNEQGSRPTFKQILGRTLSRFIPFEAFSFLGKDPRGWHDAIPKTFVVRKMKS